MKLLHATFVCQGKYAEAEPLYVRATEIYEEALGADHPYVACVLHNRAMVLNTQVRCEQTSGQFQRFRNFCMIQEA